jgi:hypothetical protein
MSAHYEGMIADQDGFVNLPGPAHWWMNYDFDKNNWSADEDAENARQAFSLVTDGFGDSIPDEYERIAPSYDRLYLLSIDESVYL